jgi:hypothetical protein
LDLFLHFSYSFNPEHETTLIASVIQMKKILSAIIILSQLVFSCKKNSDPPQVMNTNSITAQITVPGSTARSFQVSGDSTVFGVVVNEQMGDTIVTITGSDDVGTLYLNLVNPGVGTYSFPPNDTLGNNFSICRYHEGEIFSPTLIFLSNETDSAGASLTTGSYTITHFSPVGIVGSMNVTLRHTDSSELKIENCTFMGTF